MSSENLSKGIPTGAEPRLDYEGAGSRRPHLLVVGSVWPHVKENFEAANVVSHQIMFHLARLGIFELSYVYLNIRAAEIPVTARLDLAELERSGVRFLPEVLVDKPGPLRKDPGRLFRALLTGAPEHVFPEMRQVDRLLAALDGRLPDAVLTIWSEIGARVVGALDVPKFAYHGNPDHKVLDASFDLERLLGEGGHGLQRLSKWLRRTVLVSLVCRSHLAVMRRYAAVGDVASNDARFYAEQGVKAFYVPNVWPGEAPADWQARRDATEQEKPVKIVGNVGNLSATGNSFGLITLAREILPALKRHLGEGGFELHLFGGSVPRPAIRPLLDDPHIKLRGFVPDLDAEILSAPIFLVANNHHRFKVGHTRFLHAWSLGACIVAFDDCREAMPEIEHGVNALLGRNADEVAGMIAQAAGDRSRRREIGRGGADTLRRCFNPERVTHDLATRIITDLTAIAET